MNGIAFNEHLRVKLNEHCQMVRKGAKPVSFFPYQKKYHKPVIDFINKKEICFIYQTISDDWNCLYIFKNKTLKHIIVELPKTPKTPSEHALLGYLVGYDTESICEYIEKHCDLDKESKIEKLVIPQLINN